MRSNWRMNLPTAYTTADAIEALHGEIMKLVAQILSKLSNE